MILKTSAQSCALVLAVAAAVLAGCSSNADGDGDGQVSQKERATEMRRDGYLAMQPGRWKTSLALSDVDVPGLDAAQKQVIASAATKEAVSYSCLSKAEAASPGADFFGGQGSEKCSYSKFDIAGNKVDMSLTCAMGNLGRTEMQLTGTVGTDDFVFDTHATMHVPMIGAKRTIKMVGQMTGKFEGACKGDK